jgi:hypothetical protein
VLNSGERVHLQELKAEVARLETRLGNLIKVRAELERRIADSD